MRDCGMQHIVLHTAPRGGGDYVFKHIYSGFADHHIQFLGSAAGGRQEKIGRLSPHAAADAYAAPPLWHFGALCRYLGDDTYIFSVLFCDEGDFRHYCHRAGRLISV